MTLRRLLVCAIVATCAACSIFTDLSGFSGGANGASDGGDAGTDGPGTSKEASVEGGRDAGADASVLGYRAAVLADKPIAYLRFGEKSGVVANDETGHGHTAAVSGTVTWGVPGAIASDVDTAVGLDGTTSLIDLGDSIDFAGTMPFSLEIWFKASTIDTSYRFLIGKDDSPASGREEWGVVVQKVDGLDFERYVMGSGNGAGTSAMSLRDRWVHSASVYDGQVLAFYIDGALIDQSPDTRPQLTKKVPLYVGSDGMGHGVFDGTIDELAIYDFALSAARIKAHFDAAK